MNNQSPKNFYVYSNEHQAFWRPNGCGYTTDILQAGLYTRGEAAQICFHLRSHVKGELPPEVAYLESDLSAPDREKVELRRDAERYRAIRGIPCLALLNAIKDHYGSFVPAKELDKAVDAAIAAREGVKS